MRCTESLSEQFFSSYEFLSGSYVNICGQADEQANRIGMAGVQATVTNLSMDNSSDGTSIQGSDAARLMVSITA
jgi:hypothetical protein